jgi:transposase-like protein
MLLERAWPEVCREIEVSEQTYYRWRQKYGGMSPDMVKQHWELQKEIIAVCFEAELRCGRVFSATCYTTEEMEESPLRSSPLVSVARREGQHL